MGRGREKDGGQEVIWNPYGKNGYIDKYLLLLSTIVYLRGTLKWELCPRVLCCTGEIYLDAHHDSLVGAEQSVCQLNSEREKIDFSLLRTRYAAFWADGRCDLPLERRCRGGGTWHMSGLPAWAPAKVLRLAICSWEEVPLFEIFC